MAEHPEDLEPAPFFAESPSLFSSAGVKAFIGGMTGSSARKEKRRQEVAQMRQGFAEGRAAFESFRKTGKTISEQYVSTLASERARFAGSGGELTGGMWDAVVGRTLFERDRALGALEGKKQAFRASPQGVGVRKGYDEIVRAYSTVSPVRGRQASPATAGAQTGKVMGTPFFTTEQADIVGRNIDALAGFSQKPGGRQRTQRLATVQKIRSDYLARVMPTFEEYELQAFGSAEEKADVGRRIGQRIDQASEFFTRQKTAYELNF